MLVSLDTLGPLNDKKEEKSKGILLERMKLQNSENNESLKCRPR
jgi:hypothetical protein